MSALAASALAAASSAAATSATDPTASAEKAQPFLRIDHLVKDFGGGGGALAVDHVSLDIVRGEIFALLGSSGCGKTTLLRMLAGFETPTSGRILFAGRDIAAMPAYERPFNMMFQSYALFPHLSVFENIAFGLRRDGMPKPQLVARVEAMLKLVQLGAYARRKPHQLSGGQQQRVALARSLAKRPQVLLLDEPLGALDKKLREQTQIELVNIVREVGVTCVMVTHDQEEAMTMASRIAVMSEGRVLQVGPPADIYERPATRFVADFIGSVNLMDGRVRGAEADGAVFDGAVVDGAVVDGAVVDGAVVDGGVVDCAVVDGGVVDCADCSFLVAGPVVGQAGAQVSVALRPEKIVLSATPAAAGDGLHNRVQGTVRELSYFGSYSVYHLQLASGAMLKISESNVAGERGARLRIGDTAWGHWSPSAPVVMLP